MRTYENPNSAYARNVYGALAELSYGTAVEDPGDGILPGIWQPWGEQLEVHGCPWGAHKLQRN